MDDPIKSSRHQSSQTLYIFWPSAYPLDSTGFLIGWKTETVYCIATLVPNNSESMVMLNQALDQFGKLSAKQTQAQILGQALSVDSPLHASSTKQDNSWIRLIFTGGKLHLVSSEEEEEKLILVIYDQPSMRKHHFLSLRPLLKPSLFSNDVLLLSSSTRKSLNKNDPLAQKIKSFEEFYPEYSLPGRSVEEPRGMSQLIDFVNSSEDLHDRVHNSSASHQPHQPIQTHPKSDSGDDLCNPRPSHLDSILALSTFLQQVNVRLVEIFSWPSRYQKITKEKDTDLASRRAEYVMLFNTLWLITNDIIFGRAVGTVLMENSKVFADWLEYYLTMYTVIFVKQALNWTNSYPVGLKLNDQLGQAFCNWSIMAIDFWHNYVLKFAFSALPQLIWIVGVISFFGNTFTLAISSDFLTITTFHLWIIYRWFTFIFDYQLRFLGVLFNIFRGRKYNELRKRNEPATYQLDQLILGTILFTIAIFLFPTILAFYILTSTTRVVIIWTHGIIITGLSLLNHFPLFVLMLRFKDPARLPAGVSFVPCNDHAGIYFRLRNVPVGLPWIFSDYISLWANLTAHYSPHQLVYDLCFGKPIAPLSSCRVYMRP